MKNTQLTEAQKNLLEQVKQIVVDTEGRAVIASVPSVATSGMSRKVKFALITKDNKLLYITNLIGDIIGIKEKKGTLTVRGCGMDMIFHTLETFYSEIGLTDSLTYANNYMYF